MTESIHLDDLLPERVVSRRNLLIGASATAVGVGAVLSAGSTLQAAAPRTEAFGAAVAGLQYLPIDGLEFFPDGLYNGGSDPRYSDPLTGVGVAFGGGHTAAQLATGLPLPVGSVIRQINVSYWGTPIINVYAKPLANTAATTLNISTSLTAGAGSKTQTFTLDGSTPALAPITVEAATTYTLRFYVGAGDTIHGVTVGYTAPQQGFVVATGDPRVLNTRIAGGKLNPNEERSIAVGLPGARSALFNLTVVNTEGAGGFVACFAANVAYPGNSSINWFGADQILANSVLSAVDASGAIKIRGGANRTDVVIDRIGYFY
jgi:hypothetical protein